MSVASMRPPDNDSVVVLICGRSPAPTAVLRMMLMTIAPTADHAHIPKAIRHGLLALAVLGFAGMLLTSAFGFEEPNSLLLSASVAMVFAAPIESWFT